MSEVEPSSLVMLMEIWAITDSKVDESVRRIVEFCHPRKIILFGSYVQGRTDRDSDVDILVVVGNEIENTRKESARIRRALRGIVMAMDILVVREDVLEQFRDTPGLIYREALKHGRTVYEQQ